MKSMEPKLTVTGRSKLLAAMIVGLLFAAAGCEQQGPAEEAGENIDEAVENAAEELEEAADDIRDETD